jgi:hypothetical protein
MAIFFAFELAAVAKRSLYLPTLEDTNSIFDVGLRIQAFRQTLDKTRAWKLIRTEAQPTDPTGMLPRQVRPGQFYMISTTATRWSPYLDSSTSSTPGAAAKRQRVSSSPLT